MEYKQYDLSNEEEIAELSKLSITDIEDDFLTDIIAHDQKSRNTLNLVYASLGLFD